MTALLPRSKSGRRTSRIANLSALGLALGYTALTFGAAVSPAPAQAQATGTYYTVELAQPTSETRAVAGGVAWRCEGTTCVASKGASRPLRICRELQRKVGDVAAFTTQGEALDAKGLERCNS